MIDHQYCIHYHQRCINFTLSIVKTDNTSIVLAIWVNSKIYWCNTDVLLMTHQWLSDWRTLIRGRCSFDHPLNIQDSRNSNQLKCRWKEKKQILFFFDYFGSKYCIELMFYVLIQFYLHRFGNLKFRAQNQWMNWETVFHIPEKAGQPVLEWRMCMEVFRHQDNGIKVRKS